MGTPIVLFMLTTGVGSVLMLAGFS